MSDTPFTIHEHQKFMTKYDEHRAFLVRAEAGARAERWGFDAAKMFPTCPPYSKDEYEQRRYEQGFEDGTMLLLQEKPRDPKTIS